MGARVGELLTVLALGEQPLKYHLGRDGNLFGWWEEEQDRTRSELYNQLKY